MSGSVLAADDALLVAGLPLHPLLVHAVVVLLPLAAVALVLAQFWPAARRRLGVVTPLAALVVLALVPITVSAGEALADVVGSSSAVETHEAYGRMLLPWVIALAVLALAQWGWFRWGAGRVDVTRAARRAVALVLTIAVPAVAAGTLVTIVLIGDSGARAVWGGLVG